MKMLLSSWIEVGPLMSLLVIAVLLGITVTASLIFAKSRPQLEAPESEA
jgi:tellurite resistance protein TerC